MNMKVAGERRVQIDSRVLATEALKREAAWLEKAVVAAFVMQICEGGEWCDVTLTSGSTSRTFEGRPSNLKHFPFDAGVLESIRREARLNGLDATAHVAKTVERAMHAHVVRLKGEVDRRRCDPALRGAAYRASGAAKQQALLDRVERFEDLDASEIREALARRRGAPPNNAVKVSAGARSLAAAVEAIGGTADFAESLPALATCRHVLLT